MQWHGERDIDESPALVCYDDILFGDNSDPEYPWIAALERFDEQCQKIGATCNESKSQGPGKKVVCIGVLVDLEAKTLEVGPVLGAKGAKCKSKL